MVVVEWWRGHEIYLRSFRDPGQHERVTVSLDGGMEAVWSPDGRTIYHCSRAGRLIAARLNMADGASVTERESILDPYLAHGYSHFANYDVHPSGDRFLMIESATPGGDNAVTVVVNWIEELKARGAVR